MPYVQPNRVKRFAFVAMILLVLWFASSLVIAPTRQDGLDQPSQSTETITPVLSVQEMKAQLFRRYITVNGETEANKVVGLMAETSGKVVSIPAQEGQPIKKGQIIFTIDERDRRAQLARAKAVLKQREIQYKAAQKLQKQGFQSEVRLAETRANLEVARADLESIEQDLSFTKLRAPFDGVLDAINVELGDFVFSGGQGVMPDPPTHMVDLNPMIVKGFVSENDRAVVRVGDAAKVTLNDGSNVEGVISYLASVSESESRSFRIEIEVPNDAGNIASGVTAIMKIPAKEQLAYRIPSSVLSLNDAGTIGVKYLVDNTVTFGPVNLLEEDEKGVWVSGLPSLLRLITGGQVYVSNGQKVKPEMYQVKKVNALISPSLEEEPENKAAQ